jgi:hypothetical protein
MIDFTPTSEVHRTAVYALLMLENCKCIGKATSTVMIRVSKCYVLLTVHLDMCFNETNVMHCLPSVCSVTITLHVSSLLVDSHREVTMYICNNWYVWYVLVDCWRTWLEWGQFHDVTMRG